MEGTVLTAGEGKVVAVGSHSLRYLQRGATAGYALIEVTSPPAVPGPPLHIHRQTDEGFYVVEGTFGLQIGEQTIGASTGTYVHGPRGTPHTYWNQGTTQGKILIIISPPEFEQFFEELSEGLTGAGDSIEAGIRVRKALSAKYDIDVVGPPRQA